MKLGRLALVLILPLLMNGCFLAPGAFTAALDLKKDGSFTFAYKGEIVFLDLEELGGGKEFRPKQWKDSMAICSQTEAPRFDQWAGDFDVIESGGAEAKDAAAAAADAAEASLAADNAAMAADANFTSEEGAASDDRRPCTPAEIASLKQQFADAEAARIEKDKKEAAQMAAMFGFNPMDEAANARLASTLTRYEGWRGVTYKGKGVYEVDYRIDSRTAHDFVFPLFPQGDILIPFVTVRALDKGSVRVIAPALIGGGFKAMASQMKALGMPAEKGMPPASNRTRGTFTVTTEGEILTNNTENGPTLAGGVRTLVWEINPETSKTPETLIKLR